MYENKGNSLRYRYTFTAGDVYQVQEVHAVNGHYSTAQHC